MARRRLSTQILVSHLAILIIAVGAGFALYVHAGRQARDEEYMKRALAIAQATAALPEVQRGLAQGDPTGALAGLGERIRLNTGAAYVVIIDRTGVRHSHPDPALIGRRVEEPVVALDGRPHTGHDKGHLGLSANAKAPVVASGAVVGEISAGILEKEVSIENARALRALLLYAGLALALGLGTAFLLTRRLKRQTLGLELHEIAELLQEREAMLHGIREGVVILDTQDRVTLVNDEARRLLGLKGVPLGRSVADLVPSGRLRDLLTGGGGRPDDEVVLTDEHCLKVNRMPVVHQGRPLGAVVTLRDRTEHVELLRELDSVRSLTDALRAQQHEHANRMHTVAGLLELDRPADAAAYLDEVSGAAAGLAESLRDRIGSPTLVALLLGKVTIARERGVRLFVEAAEPVRGVDGRVLVTVVGNLIDNAIDAAALSPSPEVTVELGTDPAGALVIGVRDSGPGVGTMDPEVVFADGYSTKATVDGVHRGLGLALVHRLVTRSGGTITVRNDGGACFRVVLPRDAPVGAVPSP
ncbi:MAG: two-component system, CitB family, sensor kinase [Frankiales bacterium]|nr:two-component system, CitB family, sensor kinase [Frankiales bacterium]